MFRPVRRMLAAASALAAVGAATATPAAAQTVYASRAAFLAAIGAAQTYDFNGVNTGPAQVVPVAGIGPLTFASDNGTNVSVYSPLFDPVYDYGTGNILALAGPDPQRVTITSPTPLTAFGIDFGLPDFAGPGTTNVPFTFSLNSGFSTTVFATGSGPAGGIKTFQFFGVVSPVAFTSVTFSVRSGAFQLAQYDNLTVATVPEPTTVALVGAGVSLLLGLAARRRARAS